VRVVLCDDDGLLRESVEALIPKVGHEIVGIADSTAVGVSLVEASRPDAVVFDMSLGYNTDFDVIEAALEVGAKVVVFSYNADDAILARYAVRPTVVHKPDLTTLEMVLGRLEIDDQQRVVEGERRSRPTREAAGPVPTGVVDAAAFYEAINEARPGDAMVSIELPVDAEHVAVRLIELLRSGDRLLASGHAVRVFLVAGGDEGVRSFVERLAGLAVLPPDVKISAITVADGEAPTDAFERLRTAGEPQPFPPV
jgi:chemotaxis response regulator CheB